MPVLAWKEFLAYGSRSMRERMRGRREDQKAEKRQGGQKMYEMRCLLHMSLESCSSHIGNKAGHISTDVLHLSLARCPWMLDMESVPTTPD